MRSKTYLPMVILIMFSCAKKEEAPICNNRIELAAEPLGIVPPSSYLPAYPGSWWEYSDGSRITTSETYQIAQVLSYQWEPNHGLKHCCLEGYLQLPIYDGFPLMGYTRMRLQPNDGACHETLLSEQLGAIFIWGGSHYGRTKSKVIATDTTIVLSNGTVYPRCIIVKRAYGMSANYFDSSGPWHFQIYAENVGMIKEWQLLGPGANEKELVDHYLAQ